MIGFKPVKNRGKVEFHTHVKATMPSHFVLQLKVIILLHIMRTASYLDFLLPVAIVAITVAICYFGIIGILPMKGSYLVLVSMTSIYQPLWLFSRLFFLCLFDMRASQKASRTALMFLSFDLSEHSGLMYLVGGSLALSSLSSLSSKDINWIALCRSNKAFILALSSGEICALSYTSVQFVNFWTPKELI